MSEAENDGIAPRPSPYKGLVPYSDDDAPYFFGRDRERQIIADNLQAARLTLIYGESGVGKSSVLRAGVVHHLRRQAQEALRRRIAAQREGHPDGEIERPRFVVVEFATWQDDPMVGLPGAIETSARLIFGDQTPAAPAPTRRLDELIQEWTKRLGADLLIILDQFEEYLLYHPSDAEEGTFAVEFARAIGRADLRANFVVAIREDSLAKLDRFKGRINFLANYYRVRHLDRESARDAILKPVERHNSAVAESEAVTVEAGLVERVLRDVAQGQVVVGQVGRGMVATDAAPEDRIEAPYLQLVMDRLWREERSRGSTVLRLATLEELGGAQRIVRTHLDEAMGDLPPDRRDLAASVFRFLVTPGGTKIALSATDLAEFAAVPVAELTVVLEDLATSRTRILRSVVPPDGETEVRYEIYHDVLAPAILDWRTRYVEERRRIDAEERIRQESEARVTAVRRRAGRLALLGLLASVAAVLVIAVAFVVTDQIRARNEATVAAEAAQRAAEKSERDAVVARTETEAGTHVEQALETGADPQISLQHALMAWDVMTKENLPPSPRIETALRTALSRSHLTGVVREHTDVVWSGTFNFDGSQIVTASEDGTARIVDAATAKTVRVLQGHKEPVTGALFSPDGKRVVTSSEDGSVKVWDPTTGEVVWTLSHGDADPVLSQTDVRDSNGDYVATGSFTKDGRYLTTSAGTSAWIWDLTTGDPVELKDPDGNYVYSSSFSPDGTLVLTGTYRGLDRIWDVATRKVLGEAMDNETDWVNSSTFSPDGKLIATADADGSVGIWNASTRMRLARRLNHIDEAKSVIFSADSRLLLTAGDTTAYVVDVSGLTDDDESTGAFLSTAIHQQASYVDSAEFSPDGRYVVTANQDGTARVADSATGEELFTLGGHTDIVWTADFSPDGNRVVTASEDGTVRVWDVDSGVEMRGNFLPVNSVRFSPDGASILTTAWDGNASTWDTSNGTETCCLFGTTRTSGWYPMRSAEFVGDGREVLTAQADGTVAFWDLSDQKVSRTCCTVTAAGGGIWVPTWAEAVPGHPDRAVVAYVDQSVHVWDLSAGETGSDVQTFKDGAVRGFTISPDGTTIVTVGRDDKLARVWRANWDSNTFQEVGGWSSGLVSSLDFDPDGSRVVMGGLDGVVRVWDLSTGKQVIHERDDEMRVPAGAVAAATFNSDGTRILAGGSDGVVRIWDAATASFLADLSVHAGSVNSIDTFSDGRIATASDDHSAKVFECKTCGPIDEVIKLARDQAAVDPMELSH